MTKRMLIDDTQPEETRVVVVNGNKLEDVEFETSSRKQIKGNIYLGKIMRVEPSLQACFVDYGGNKHGFMAFGEIHPDYYNISNEEIEAVEKEVDEIIENKKRIAREKELERERRAKERAKAREEALRAKEEAEKEETPSENEADESNDPQNNEPNETEQNIACEIAENNEANAEAKVDEEVVIPVISEDEFIAEEEAKAEEDGKKPTKRRMLKKKYRKTIASDEKSKKTTSKNSDVKVMAENSGLTNECVSQDIDEETYSSPEEEENNYAVKGADYQNEKDTDGEDGFDNDDDDDENMDFELQRKLIKARKLYHAHKIQDVIKEGQIVLVQVVKEERGNKGAALTTYLSLAGRYCVLMPNRIKSGGVSRKITNAADRNRLKGIVKELPLNPDMSIIVRTAGEEKTKADIVRDYNYLIRAWNQIRIDALKNKAPKMIFEEGNLIKRALRDIYSKEISEILVAGENAYKLAKGFFKILSPHNLKKIKAYKNADIPLFQRFQVEGQLDKLHDTNAQLESGGYLVINPTEALVSIDVNSGRATKEKDLEETALKTNLEACDEIARQLRLRNLAGLVVIDFIDMDEPANNHAVEKRMKEALKKDRSRIQVGKMSMFGLLELSRQRMHSAFWESNYQICPHCHGKGIVRTHESAAIYVLRLLEEEAIKNRSSKITISIPTDVAVYLLNQKRKNLVDLENKYRIEIAVCADSSIFCITDYKMDKVKAVAKEEKNLTINVEQNDAAEEKEIIVEEPKEIQPSENNEDGCEFEEKETSSKERRTNFRGRRNRFDRRRDRNKFNRNRDEQQKNNKQEAVILYDSHNDTGKDEPKKDEKKEKSAWWKKLIKG